MEDWMLIWEMVLIAVIAIYGLVVVFVGLGGVRDLAAMFKRLRADDEPEKKPPRR